MWILFGILLSHFIMASAMSKMMVIVGILTIVVIICTLGQISSDLEKFRNWWHKDDNNRY